MTSATADLDLEQGQPDISASEGGKRPSYDDVNSPVVMMVGVISTIVTLITIFFVQGLFYQWQNSFIRERSFDTANTGVAAIVADQQKLLLGDPERGIKSVEQAIDEVIRTYGRNGSAGSEQTEAAPAGG